jgi:hypothetical protein
MIWRAVLVLFGFLKSWIGALIAILAALYYGPRKMLETWDWYVYRFRDYDVYEIIDQKRDKETVVGGKVYTNVPPVPAPYSVQEIATKLRRTESSVTRSLKRLKHSKKAAQRGDGWFSADIVESLRF